MKTKTFLFNKLVRDKSVATFEKDGCKVEWRSLDDNEDFLAALAEKIVEELEEAFEAESHEEIVQELADIEEVLAAFKELVQVSQADVDAARKKKKAERGSFSERVFIEYIEAPVGSKTDKYGTSHPEKYPEIDPAQLAALALEDLDFDDEDDEESEE